MADPPNYVPDRPPPSIDPTVLTTQQLRREIELLERALDRRLDNYGAELTARLDLAKELNEAEHGRIQALLEAKMLGHWQLDDKREAEIAERFRLLDQRAERERATVREALEAAFKAQKELGALQETANQKAIAKSDATTQENIGKLGELIASNVDALSSKLDDLKERVGRIESVKVGVAENRTGIMAAIGLIATIIVTGIVVIGFFAARGGP